VSDQPTIPQGPQPHSPRSASVMLRPGEGEVDRGPQLDPANQSLADALNLVFRALQIAMLFLFGYFALSGFQSIKENEKGVRLVFGKRVASDLPPGFQFSYPYPLGELLRVDTGERRMELDESFWPQLSAEQRRMTLQQLVQTGRPSIKPETDGSVITGDANLAHTQWQVRYQRSDPARYVENVLDEEGERQLIRAAVERGVVHAVATTSIDDLLKQTGSDQASVAVRAQEIAQETLERVGAGVQIVQVTLREKVPPFFAYGDFAGVQSAEQKASAEGDKAESRASETLNNMAGAAYPHLIRQIDAYEAALALGDTQELDQIMDTIRGLLEGRPVQVAGQTVKELSSGRVRQLLNDARSYRTTVVTTARSDLETYRTKLAQFRVNPDVVVKGDWADAMARLLSREVVEILWLPPGTNSIDMWLNRDPAHVKERAEAQKRERLKREEERRMREANEARFRTDTSTMEIPG
jgi:regulator of protease activity HflC (stomatin/prohibitin superfamily)